MFKEITTTELHDIVEQKKSGVVIIDVRFPFEVKSGKVPGALNIPMSDITACTEELKKYDTVYLVCQSGGRSMLAATQLDMLGFGSVYNMTGGMRLWREQGYPLEL